MWLRLHRVHGIAEQPYLSSVLPDTYATPAEIAVERQSGQLAGFWRFRWGEAARHGFGVTWFCQPDLVPFDHFIWPHP